MKFHCSLVAGYRFQINDSLVALKLLSLLAFACINIIFNFIWSCFIVNIFQPRNWIHNYANTNFLRDFKFISSFASKRESFCRQNFSNRVFSKNKYNWRIASFKVATEKRIEWEILLFWIKLIYEQQKLIYEFHKNLSNWKIANLMLTMDDCLKLLTHTYLHVFVNIFASIGKNSSNKRYT